jgi:ubiquinone/menaquinone biosynthesis C-methylase UbiE
MKKPNPTRRFIARFMRAFFYLLYQPMAWSYDIVAALVSWGRWKGWILAVLPYLKGPRILEMGHGPGHLLVALHEQGIPALGIDASCQMGQQAYKRLLKCGQISNLVTGYAQNLPYPDHYFDQVVATFPTEYIQALETLDEVHRVLKPGGLLVVLPVAWITGQRLSDRGTAALFRITGQAPEWDDQWLEPFSKAGFETKAEKITQKSWELIIILAKSQITITEKFRATHRQDHLISW